MSLQTQSALILGFICPIKVQYIAFNWIEKKYPDFKRQYDKEWQDQIHSWKNSKHLPSSQSIALLKDKYEGDEKTVDWDELQSLLLLARAVDFYKDKCAKLFLIPDKKPHHQYFLLIQNIEGIESQLQISKNKKETDPENILSNINHIRKLLQETKLQP